MNVKMYDKLKEILCSTLLVGIDKQRKTLKLKEPSAKKYRNNPILLHGLPENAVVIKLDKQCNYLNKSCANINQSCDYVILLEKKGKPFAVFIELKTKHAANAYNQIKFSIPFVKYIEAILLETGSKIIFNQKYAVFKVIKKLAKQTPKNKPYKTEKIEKRELKIFNKCPNINVGKLIS